MKLPAPVVATYFEPLEVPRLPFWRRCFSFGTVLGVHVLGLVFAVTLAVRPDLMQPVLALTVRMLDIAPTPPKVEPPKPKPVAIPARKAPIPPPPIMTVANTTTAPTLSSFVVAPQPEPRPVESHPAPPAPVVPMVAARFDADYLHNPPPIYPPMSRRQSEEGKVVLRVRVSSQGAALAVEIKQSSGMSRLDEAARSAVEKWRFVPARQGNEAVEASVLVPLHFTLDR